MITNGLLTLLTLIGCFVFIVLIVIGFMILSKWVDKKLEGKQPPKWVKKLESITENLFAILFLLAFLVATFIMLYQLMWF